jgi:PIN domain nuclease of toxin-antitoxin system
MPNAVTDTHALIWYLQDDPRLSQAAVQYFSECEHDGGRIYAPSICVVEIIYLAEKGRIPADTLTALLTDLNASDTVLEIVDLTLSITLRLNNVSRSAIPGMPDRIIAATALHLGFPVISRDGKIRLFQLTTVW